MGDSAITIEYLRARLLSERSVSKSARQRADELADRVVELEEQLKVVYLQRKKTEKATSDVLAILGSLGISDDSEGCDLSSDQDLTHPQACSGNCSEKKTDKSRSMDQQGFESPTFSCRSLSWKSSKCSSHCERKFVSAPSRRRSSYSCTDFSSPKHHLGKSCRQIKRREMRSTVDEPSKNEAISDSQIADEDSKISRCNHKNQDEELSAGDTESICIKSPRKLIDSEDHCHKYEGDKEMQRALERQAELINRYESEENAQIEWEEKYKENNSSTPESIEPGNQSDVTEERDELKRQPACSQPVNVDVNSGVKGARTDEVCRILSNENDVQPSPLTTDGPKQYQNLNPEVYTQTFHIPMNEMKQIQDKPEGCSSHPPSSAIHQSLVSNYCEGETSKTPTKRSMFVSHEPSKELGSVLEALQRAKLSLQHKLRKSSLPENRFMGKAVEPHPVPAMGSPARDQMAASLAALFRVPTNLQTEANVYKSYSDSRSHSSLMDISTSVVPVNGQFELKSQEGATTSSVSEGSSFDFAPNWKTTVSSLGSGDDYARSPVPSEKGFSNSDRFKSSPQIGTPRSTFIRSDGESQSPYDNPHFSFLTSDLYRSSSQLENNRSSIYGGDLHAQGAYVNRSSPSSSDRQELNIQGEATTSSPIDNDQFAKTLYSCSRLSMSSPTQLLSNTTSGSPQPLSAEPHYIGELDIYRSSHARHIYEPAHPSVPDFNPAIPTFRGFPSFLPSPGSSYNHGTGMYRI